MLSNKLYDALKFIAQIALPAAGTAYLGLAGYWDVPNPDEVVGTIVVVDTLLGTLLGLSTKQYNANENNFAGVVHTAVTDEGQQFLLEVNDPSDVADKDVVTLKVQKH